MTESIISLSFPPAHSNSKNPSLVLLVTKIGEGLDLDERFHPKIYSAMMKKRKNLGGRSHVTHTQRSYNSGMVRAYSMPKLRAKEQRSSKDRNDGPGGVLKVEIQTDSMKCCELKPSLT